MRFSSINLQKHAQIAKPIRLSMMAVLASGAMTCSVGRAEPAKPCSPQPAQSYTRPVGTTQPAQSYTRPAGTPQMAQSYNRPAASSEVGLNEAAGCK